MINISTNETPRLDQPGKGLPKLELMFARMLVGLKSRITSRNQSEAIFELEKNEILSIAKSVEPHKGSQRVLIKRLKGLEDSSRFWSIYMTLDHLRIVNQGTINLIETLVRGGKPEQIISTAAVKPRVTAGSEVLKEFEVVCNQFQQSIYKIKDLKTKNTWAHPWFGELNAEKWFFFSGFHMNLHRKQILSILKKL